MDNDEKHLKAFVQVCRAHGIKATHQRMEIYRELARTEEHPDVETIFKSVRRRIPAISLDTVYRTLRLLEEKGVISRVGSLGERTRFDANISRHHHFICEQCGMVRDFYSEELSTFPPPREVQTLGAVQSVHVEMRGLCSQCAETNKPKLAIKKPSERRNNGNKGN